MYIRSVELLEENEYLSQTLKATKNESALLTDSVARLRVYEEEANSYHSIESKFITETKLKDYERDLKNIREDYHKMEIEYKVLIERHNETAKRLAEKERELESLRNFESSAIRELEQKTDRVTSEVIHLRAENKNLHNESERQKRNLMEAETKLEDSRGQVKLIGDRLELSEKKVGEVIC